MYEGASELLAELKGRIIGGGIAAGEVNPVQALRRLAPGVITNGPSNVQRPKLEALDQPGWFPEHLVFVSGEFGARKPDPAIFRAAARAAGVEPHECVMVGDAREFDMPAKAVGFRTILFTGPRKCPDITKDEWQPDAIVASYNAMRDLFSL
jgi:FMN phosphatase YigB (HAD superfamily)